MKIELKLGNSAGIVYGNCLAGFSRPGVTCETSCNVVCDIALWWSPRTNQRALYCTSLVFTRKKRFRDTLLANCWIVKRMPKNRKFPPDQVSHSESRCYRNDRVRNACNVVPQRYSRQHEYYFADNSWKIGNIAGNTADKTGISR